VAIDKAAEDEFGYAKSAKNLNSVIEIRNSKWFPTRLRWTDEGDRKEYLLNCSVSGERFGNIIFNEMEQ